MNKLEGVHPELIDKVHRILMAMNALGHPMVVTDGVRTAEEQHALYEQGRTKPGKIVTNADGYAKKSNHQPHEDGLGHAVDLAFVDANGRPTWDDKMPWATYGACAEALGLTWGGRFQAIRDFPHIELIG
jgi:peptidoglycan L-alanyl-D-glutamate endopeptidase CwlK